jgi:flagellar biosynthesis/type III secretory pathway M-ring protein FliF/YscJ
MFGTTIDLSLVALGLAILAVFWMLAAMRVRRQLEKQTKQLETVKNDLRALCNAAVHVGERVIRLERNHGQLQLRQQELGVRQEQMTYTEPEERVFDQAIKLAQKGGSIEEIMDICDLSRGAAELVAMMHRLGGE